MENLLREFDPALKMKEYFNFEGGFEEVEENASAHFRIRSGKEFASDSSDDDDQDKNFVKSMCKKVDVDVLNNCVKGYYSADNPSPLAFSPLASSTGAPLNIDIKSSPSSMTGVGKKRRKRRLVAKTDAIEEKEKEEEKQQQQQQQKQQQHVSVSQQSSIFTILNNSSEHPQPKAKTNKNVDLFVSRVPIAKAGKPSFTYSVLKPNSGFASCNGRSKPSQGLSWARSQHASMIILFPDQNLLTSENVRSTKDNLARSLKLENDQSSSTKIQVFWISYDGKKDLRKTLKPGESYIEGLPF